MKPRPLFGRWEWKRWLDGDPWTWRAQPAYHCLHVRLAARTDGVVPRSWYWLATASGATIIDGRAETLDAAVTAIEEALRSLSAALQEVCDG